MCRLMSSRRVNGACIAGLWALLAMHVAMPGLDACRSRTLLLWTPLSRLSWSPILSGRCWQLLWLWRRLWRWRLGLALMTLVALTRSPGLALLLVLLAVWVVVAVCLRRRQGVLARALARGRCR
jgi:hypothetical protein